MNSASDTSVFLHVEELHDDAALLSLAEPLSRLTPPAVIVDPGHRADRSMAAGLHLRVRPDAAFAAAEAGGLHASLLDGDAGVVAPVRALETVLLHGAALRKRIAAFDTSAVPCHGNAAAGPKDDDEVHDALHEHDDPVAVPLRYITASAAYGAWLSYAYASYGSFGSTTMVSASEGATPSSSLWSPFQRLEQHRSSDEDLIAPQYPLASLPNDYDAISVDPTLLRRLRLQPLPYGLPLEAFDEGWTRDMTTLQALLPASTETEGGACGDAAEAKAAKTVSEFAVPMAIVTLMDCALAVLDCIQRTDAPPPQPAAAPRSRGPQPAARRGPRAEGGAACSAPASRRKRLRSLLQRRTEPEAVYSSWYGEVVIGCVADTLRQRPTAAATS